MNEAIPNFEELHETYRPKIRRYLANMVGEGEAEDLTQEVFLKVHRGLESFKGESSLSTWIYRIASNAAVDRLRSPAFRRSAESEPLPEDDGPGGRPAAAPAGLGGQSESSPERQVFLREGFDCYCDAIGGLPAGYRAVVALSELGDRTAEEIAALLGLTPGAAKIRLHRGRLRLLRELRARCKAEDWL